MATFKEIDPTKLTVNQELFIHDAESDGLKIHEYTGRGMYGVYCPAVHVEDAVNDLTTRAKVQIDNLGKGFVIYCQ